MNAYMEIPTVDTILMEPPAEYKITPPDTSVTNHIHIIRGQKVMLDSDLAELYGVETKQLKRQVRRNMGRFPADFMFELTLEEEHASRSQSVTLKFESPDSEGDNNLRSQIGTSSWGGTRYLPMAFTEQGVAMLSSVLGSEQAILVNIHIIRVFIRMREALLSSKDILQKLERLEEKVTDHDGEIQQIFDSLTEMISPPEAPRKSIGFKPTDA